MSCEGKVALVTGAAGSGLGRSIALTLAREGASVVVNYRTSEESARDDRQSHRKSRRQALAVPADMFDAGECHRLVETTLAEFGQIDICIVGTGRRLPG